MKDKRERIKLNKPIIIFIVMVIMITIKCSVSYAKTESLTPITSTTPIANGYVDKTYYYIYPNQSDSSCTINIDMFGATAGSGYNNQSSTEAKATDTIPAGTTRMYIFTGYTTSNSRETCELASVDITLNSSNQITGTSNQRTLIAIAWAIEKASSQEKYCILKNSSGTLKLNRFTVYGSSNVVTKNKWTESTGSTTLVDFADSWSSTSVQYFRDVVGASPSNYVNDPKISYLYKNAIKPWMVKYEDSVLTNFSYTNGQGSSSGSKYVLGKIILTVPDKSTPSVTLNPTSLTFTYGDSARNVTVTRDGDGVISASSSNTGVATVSVSGTIITVTPKEVGTATVTVNVAEGSSYYAATPKTFNVTVNQKPATISYATTSVSKTNGDARFTNTLTNTGDGTVTYSSNNTSVATINSSTGEVTIKGAGSATITATVADGKNYSYATKTARYTLTVTAPTITGSIKITGTNTYGQTLTANTSSISPTGCTLTYQWWYSTSSTATSGTNISGATSSTLVLNNSTYVGKYIGVTVNASKTNYTAKSFTDITDSTNNTTATVSKASGYVNLSATSGTITYGTTSKTFTVSSHHGGTLSVTERTSTAATVSISGTTVTISTLGSLSMGTTVTVRVTSAATTTHNSAYKDYTLTVSGATITGSIKITGTNTYGQTLKANTSSISPTGCELTYQWWYSTSSTATSGTKITGATSSTLVLDKSTYVGKYIGVTVNASKTNYTSKNFTDITDSTNNTTAKVSKASGYVNLSATSGTITYGTTSKTFTVSSHHGGTLSVAETTSTAATVSISGTTVTISTLGNLSIGTTVTVRVTSAATTTHNSAYQDYTLTVIDATITGSITITGTNTYGQTLKANTSSISPTGCTLTYQWWYSTSSTATSGTTITGATSSTLVLNNSTYVGKYIGVTVNASKTNYTSKSFTDITDSTNNTTATVSKASGYVNLSATSGTITYGTTSKTFTVSSHHGGTLSVAERTSTAATVSISGTTVTIATLGGLNAGTTVTVRVTSSATTTHNSAYKDYTLTVTEAPITGSIKITGTNTYGQTLTANTSSINPTGCTLKYQWWYSTSSTATNGTNISGATSSTLVLDNSTYVGKYIGVTVNASKTNYTAKSFTDITDSTNNTTATVSKASGYVNLSATSGTITYGTTSKTFTVSSHHGGTLSVAQRTSTAATVSISGTTVTISTLGGLTPGTTVTVRVTSAATTTHNSAYKDYTLTVTEAPINGSIKITGTNTYGQTLTANTSSISPTGCTLKYQWWYSTSSTATSGTNISGATGTTLKLDSATYVGKYIGVTVNASKTNYTAKSFTDITDSTNNTTATVSKASGYVNLSATSGTITYGTTSKTFTVSSHHGGTLSVTERTSTAATVSISGTTVTIATLGGLNAGTTVTVRVTSSATTTHNSAYKDYTLTVNRAPGSVNLSISGTPTYGQTLTATATTASNGTKTYKWWYTKTAGATSGTNISGATGTTLKLDSATYVGKYIGCTVKVEQGTNYTECSETAITSTTVEEAIPTLTPPSNQTMVAKNTRTVSYTYNGDGAVTVSSSATGVATVTVNTSTKKITITGVAPGTATITISAAAGTCYKAKSATFTVTVQAANYSVGSVYYNTLATAYDAITGTSGTIKVEEDNTDASTYTVASGKTITLETNGKIITKTSSGIVIDSDSTLIINGTGTIQTKTDGTNTVNSLIVNSGTLTVNDGTIHNAGSTTGYWYAINTRSGTTNIKGGTIKSTLASGVTTTYNARALYVGTGTLNILGGTITSADYGIHSWATSGKINVSGGTVTAGYQGINISGTDASASVTMTGGTIKATNNSAISFTSTGKLIIGTSGGGVSTTSPVLQGETYGIESNNGFEFYDGILKGKTEAYSGTVTAMPSGYGISKGTETIDGAVYKTAKLAIKNYSVNGSYYATLAGAYTYASSFGSTQTTIVVEQSNTDSSKFTVESGKNIIINTQGNTITKTTTGLTNNGTLTINGSGIITVEDGNGVINNRGTLNISGATIKLTSKTSSAYAIDNYGTVTLSNANIEALLNISSAIIAGIGNRASGNVVMNSGTITVNSTSATNNNKYGILDYGGTVNVNGGTINMNIEGTGVYTSAIAMYQGAGTLTISNAIINIVATSSKEVQGIYALASSNVTVGENTSITVKNSGTGSGYGIRTNNSTANITGGTIIASTSGIYVQGTSTLTIGTSGGDVLKTSPVVQGGEYGVYSEKGFSFYDGILKGKTEAYNGTVTAMPSGYGISRGAETIDGAVYKTAKLAIKNYSVNGSYYETLADAYEYVMILGTSGPIKVEQNVKDTSTFTVASGKNIIINTNGKTITKTTSSLTNNGTLTINGSGIISVDDGNYVIKNNGTLNISEATIKLTSKASGIYAIDNYGIVTLSNANIEALLNITSAIIAGINNRSGGRVVMNSGTITVNSTSITNNNKYGILDRGGTVNVNGGTINLNIEGTGPYTSAIAMYQGAGTLTISNATINVVGTSSKNIQGIYALASSNVTVGENTNITVKNSGTASGYGIKINNSTVDVTGGTIIASTSGIYDEGTSTLTIGTLGGEVSITSPVVQGDTYGVQVTNGQIKFYDGILKGKTAGHDGTVTEVEPGYGISKGTETIDGAVYQTEKLVPANYSVGDAYYERLIDAYEYLTSLGDSGTIKVETSNTDNTPVTIENGKDIVIDLNGKTITVDGITSGGFITNDGTLKIIDNGANGAIKDTSGTPIVNEGKLTIGDNKGTENESKPRIEGKDYVIKSEGGEFNFESGTLVGSIEPPYTGEPKVPKGYYIKTEKVGDKYESVITKDNTPPRIYAEDIEPMVIGSGKKVIITIFIEEPESKMNPNEFTSEDLIFEVNGKVVQPEKLELTYVEEKDGTYEYILIFQGIREDGNLVIRIEQDKVFNIAQMGNVATTILEDKIKIDYKAPDFSNAEIELVEPEDGITNTGDYEVKISGVTDNYGIGEYQWEIKRKEDKSWKVIETIPSNKGNSFISGKLEEEGTYEIRVRVVDENGNYSYSNIVEILYEKTTNFNAKPSIRFEKVVERTGNKITWVEIHAIVKSTTKIVSASVSDGVNNIPLEIDNTTVEGKYQIRTELVHKAYRNTIYRFTVKDELNNVASEVYNVMDISKEGAKIEYKIVNATAYEAAKIVFSSNEEIKLITKLTGRFYASKNYNTTYSKEIIVNVSGDAESLDDTFVFEDTLGNKTNVKVIGDIDAENRYLVTVKTPVKGIYDTYGKEITWGRANSLVVKMKNAKKINEGKVSAYYGLDFTEVMTSVSTENDFNVAKTLGGAISLQVANKDGMVVELQKGNVEIVTAAQSSASSVNGNVTGIYIGSELVTGGGDEEDKGKSFHVTIINK